MAIPPSPGGRGRARKPLRGSAEILPKPLKSFLPSIHRRMLSVGRTIHREEAVTSIVVHMELVGLPPLFEFFLGFRYILRRRAPILSAKEPEQRTPQVLGIVDR